MSTPDRVLVVGLDMADGGLIRRWSREGRLPHLAALAASGAWMDLESTAEVLHTSTWPTFATGTLPGQHGVYYPYQPRPGHQQAVHIEPEQYGTETFWKLASDQGRRCLVYDVPETFSDPGFRGSAIFDWGTWAWYGKPCAQPDGLLKEIKSRFGPYPLGLEAKRLALRVPNLRRLEQRLLRSVEYKRLTTEWLLTRQEWDLAVVGFCETHPAGHYLWPAGADTVTDDSSFQPLFNVYAALDQALGRLRSSLPKNAVMMVTSGDGLRPNRCGWHLLPTALERLGYTCSAGSDSTATGPAPKPSLLGQLKRALPASARRRIADSLPCWLRNRLTARIQAAEVDWSRTRAFTLPTDLEGCVRINLKGREPEGIVEPGAPYRELCEELRSRLEEMTNPATGAGAVRQVYLSNEVFPGERRDHLPDLVVTWNDEAPFTALASPRFGVVEGVSPDPRTGTHSSDGFLLAGGAAIPRGHEGRAHLADVAPTVLGLLGLDSVDTFQGRPLRALVRGSTPRGRQAENALRETPGSKEQPEGLEV